MVNDPIYTAQQEEWRLDVNDSWQVLWWCRYLDLTKSQLECAINTVGNKIGDIRQFIAAQQDGASTPPPSIPGAAAGTTRPDFRHRTPHS